MKKKEGGREGDRGESSRDKNGNGEERLGKEKVGKVRERKAKIDLTRKMLSSLVLVLSGWKWCPFQKNWEFQCKEQFREKNTEGMVCKISPGPHSCCYCSVPKSDSLQPRELQHARLLCPPLSPRVCSDSCPLSWWCCLTISSSAPPSPFTFNLSHH